ncbi:MAG: tRNA-dihydrouridine synthase [Candidatus Komeilibacteria bacterium]|nr:tRNA-dihydrouridine synthase [Candidatus Komeilibacteria bacterium]
MENFWLKLKKPILALAPMCGVTDLPFRTICHNLGADVVYTEMIMVQALSRKGKQVMDLAKISDQERPVVLQLGGNDPELFYKAAKVGAEEIQPDGLDINFGCPAKKVAGHGSGAALLRDLEKSYQIVQAVIEGAGGLPVSLKTRTQIKSSDKAKVHYSWELLDKIKDLPVSAVMVHGRSFEAPWVEEVDYEYIKSMRNHFKGILLANGGINSSEKAKEVLELTNADGLGIGHGVYGCPWIFKQIKEYLKTGKYKDLSWPQRRKIALEHAQLAFEIKGEHGLIELRKQLLWYVKGLPNATDYREKLVRLNNLAEIKKAFMEIEG